MKKVIWVPTLLFFLLSLILPAAAYAASVPDLSRSGEISVRLEHDGKKLSGGSLTFFQVGELAKEGNSFGYRLTAPYQNCGEKLDELSSPELAERLQAYTGEAKIPGNTVPVRDGSVRYQIPAGKLGLYLVVQEEACDGYYVSNPFLVTVPYWENGGYRYQVDASLKMGIPEEIPSGPDQPEEYPDRVPGEPDDETGGGPDTDKRPAGGGGGNRLPQTGMVQILIPALLLAGGGSVWYGAKQHSKNQKKNGGDA